MGIVIGFPKFQQEVFGAFPKFFEVIPRLAHALDELTGEAHEAISAEHHLIVNLGILAHISLMEILLLATNGFGPGAQKSARSMLEATVTAEYLRLHPEQYGDFYEWRHVERHKELEVVREHLPELYASLDPELIRDVQEEFSRVTTRFGKRKAWSKHDLAEQAKKAGYTEAYRFIQPIGSGFVHVSPYGLQRRFRQEDRVRIEVPPSLSWVRESFVSGHMLALGMVRTLLKCLRPEREKVVLVELEADYNFAWDP